MGVNKGKAGMGRDTISLSSSDLLDDEQRMSVRLIVCVAGMIKRAVKALALKELKMWVGDLMSIKGFTSESDNRERSMEVVWYYILAFSSALDFK